MKTHLFIPVELKAVIKNHLKEAVAEAVDTYFSACEDEDALTGHLGSKIQTKVQSLHIQNVETGGVWKWKFDYYKFRGRGPGATESHLGADGILEFQINHSGAQSGIQRKAALFQSKMPGSDSKRLLKQTARLSNWREAAFVLNFAEDEFRGLTIDETLALRGNIDQTGVPLADFIGAPFLDCIIGDGDLKYFARERTLQWKDTKGDLVIVAFQLKHRIVLNVTPPLRHERPFWAAKEILPEDISKHRMDTRSEELLSNLTSEPIAKNPAKAIMKIYHPDLWSSADKEVQEVMEMRMKEFNDAIDAKKKSRKK